MNLQINVKKCGIDTEISDELMEQISPNLGIDIIKQVPNSNYVYRDYQERLLQSLCSAGRGVIISPTRSGKSLILAGLCHNMLLNTENNGIQNILIIVPNCQLVKQFIDDLTDYGLTENWNLVNFSSDQDKKNKKKKIDFTFETKNIIVSNSQWLMLHGDNLPYIDCIIQDEIHVCKKSSELSKMVRGVKIPYKFGCTGTLPKEIVDRWNITGIFGPVLDEIKIKELQEKNILADVSINPIKFVHGLKQNFRKTKKQAEVNDEIFDAFEAAQNEYKNESMFLSQYEPTNKIITKIATSVIQKNPHWNSLILFDYTLSGESLFNLLDWKDKHYIDGTVNLDVRTDIVDKMNDPNGGHVTVANCKCFGTRNYSKKYSMYYISYQSIFSYKSYPGYRKTD